MRLRTVWKATALGLAAAMVIAPSAMAQRPSAAESGLVGIKLFDNGLRLLAVYGQPDDIQPLGGGGAAAPTAGFPGAGVPAGVPGFPGAGGPRGGGGAGPRGGGGRGGGGAELGDNRDPFGFGDNIFQLPPSGPPPGFQPPAGYPTRGGGGGGQGVPTPAGMPPGANYPGAGAPPGFNPTTAPSFPSSGAPTGPSYSGNSQGFTRWIYKRDGGKYGFIMDSKSRIVQIEAIGLEDKRVRTRKGLTFGATFIKVIKTYGWPDSYEVSGNSITMRYQLKNKVVFRLNRLGLDKPHVVTGILIAAAKS